MKIYSIPPAPSVLIFDIDSTLYTCPEYAHEQIDSQVRYFASLRGMTAEDARLMVRNFRKSWAEEHNGKRISLGNLLTNFGVTIEESIEWRKKLFDPARYLKKDARLIESLSALKEDYYLICVTNNPVEPARRTLEALGVSEQIPRIVGLDTTHKSKPAKEIFDTAVKLAKEDTGREIKYTDCVSIGDRYDIDLALPLELGMGAVLVDGAADVYELPETLGGQTALQKHSDNVSTCTALGRTCLSRTPATRPEACR